MPSETPTVTLSVPGPSTITSNTGTSNTVQGNTVSSSALNGPRLDFPATAPAANPVFYRTYSRKTDSGRES